MQYYDERNSNSVKTQHINYDNEQIGNIKDDRNDKKVIALKKIKDKLQKGYNRQTTFVINKVNA